MAKNRGKEFENKVKEDFQKIPYSHIERIYDNTSGYKFISGRSDFIGYIYPNMYFLECKSHYGNTFPLSNITQQEKLSEVITIPGIRAGIILWMIDWEKVFYVPANTINEMKFKNESSINKKNVDKYKIIEIPSVKRRIFLDCDFSILKSLQDGD